MCVQMCITSVAYAETSRRTLSRLILHDYTFALWNGSDAIGQENARSNEVEGYDFGTYGSNVRRWDARHKGRDNT